MRRPTSVPTEAAHLLRECAVLRARITHIEARATRAIRDADRARAAAAAAGATPLSDNAAATEAFAPAAS